MPDAEVARLRQQQREAAAYIAQGGPQIRGAMLGASDALHEEILIGEDGLHPPVGRSNGIESLGFQIQSFHFVAILNRPGCRSYVAPSLRYSRFLAAIFDPTQKESIVGLLTLHQQIAADGANAGSGSQVRNCPRIKSASLGSGWLCHVSGTRKSIRQEFNRSRLYLSYRNSFGITRLRTIPGDTHRVSALLDSDGSVRIYYARKVGKRLVFSHNPLYHSEEVK